MVWHDYIAADYPILGALPRTLDNFVHFRVCEDCFAILCAHSHEHKNRSVMPLVHRLMNWMPSSWGRIHLEGWPMAVLLSLGTGTAIGRPSTIISPSRRCGSLWMGRFQA